MSYISEARGQRARGYAALQHHGYISQGVALDHRVSLIGARVIERKQEEIGAHGDYVYEDTSIGDKIGPMLWEIPDAPQSRSSDSRAIPAWRWTPWPVRTLIDFTSSGSSSGVVYTPRPPSSFRCASVPYGGIKALPVKEVDEGNGDWTADTRFIKKAATTPREGGRAVFPKPFSGQYGTFVAADIENRQDELYYRHDPRMVAVNASGDPAMGEMVVDLDDRARVDPERVARLQSAFRVLKPGPMRCAPWPSPVVSLQINGSGCGDSVGGLFFDKTQAGVIGQSLGTGPFHAGAGVADKHNIGTDGDGHAINSGHLSTNTYFFRDDVFDAPLKFDSVYEPCDDGPVSTNCFLEYDERPQHPHICGPQKGIWRWRATSYIESSNYPPDPPYRPPGDDGVRPPIEPPVDFAPGPLGPQGPPISHPEGGVSVGRAGRPGFHRLPNHRVGMNRPETNSYGWSPMELGAPGIIFQPQLMIDGAVDVRVWPAAPRKELDKQKQESPMVSRLESYGKQTTCSWSYFHEPRSGRERRHNKGSAAGGVVFLPPQLAVDDYAAGRAASVSTSDAVFAISDRSVFALGSPSVDHDIGVADGYLTRFDPDNHGGSRRSYYRAAGVDTETEILSRDKVASKVYATTLPGIRSAWGNTSSTGGLSAGFYAEFDKTTKRLSCYDSGGDLYYYLEEPTKTIVFKKQVYMSHGAVIYQQGKVTRTGPALTVSGGEITVSASHHSLQ